MEDETNFLKPRQFTTFMNAIPRLAVFHNKDHKPIISPDDTQLLFTIIHDGAFRVSEVLKLTPDDLIKEEKLLKLEGTKGTKKSKGKQKREFGWVKESAWNALVKMASGKDSDEKLFPVTRQTVWKWAKDIGKIAGIELLHINKDTTNMTVHTLRHTRAVDLADKGMKVNELMKKLRHRSLQPTTTYLTVNMDKVRTTEEALDNQ